MVDFKTLRKICEDPLIRSVIDEVKAGAKRPDLRPKHSLYYEMMTDRRVIEYRCTCGEMPIKEVTWEAFNLARGVRPWSTPRSVERAFRSHLRDAAAASRPSSAPSTTE